ncbi:hypothetical protein [Natronomonas marina]|uniref:hypothetical protein n=1 Tax=Natronomonas marina TaxID=2961939 RepID=UPI0020C99AE4|nr:hypothetical protein [Natronomonas marina]
MEDQEGSVGIEELLRATKKSEIPESEFWEELNQEAIRSFERGLDWNRELLHKSVDMIKIVLLFGSVYVGLFQFGNTQFGFFETGREVLVPLLPLLLSLFFFAYSYKISQPEHIGPSSRNAYDAIRGEISTSDYQKEMAIAYLAWGDDNAKRISKANNIFWYGISSLFASLGCLCILVIF